ncbi:MAG: 2-(1,2-epoxy-1,2-dihydrophenyl)acetyl-CoA isomerase [Chlorobi bacterium]|nr:MAG: 2-(1,2-epoxy-1,2-dihydrophenyl)acetyl-CoA isomerase [Bacteroidota bacterium]MBL1160478.1 2-(1,2-epoxy-1,2-dihydrophenyl)acetyl-CoA isomerase [Chlorobiota bacterium]MBZ0194685.1 enoyl-CoA hydratase/isomerase family protein [Candidatus Kapabacteria bacterium]MCC6331237.1 enoyl-CoA hydratase/isomerase family protein [Ignavibacteria bacterium]MBV6463031.1 1,2-epoxyphenylacetyl-CoA isomerase [Chlorobiota bacterium]
MDTILYDSTDGVCTITLNRPESYNAVNEQLSTELLHALTQAETDAGVRCVVLTGAGKAFCSGQDLKDAPTGGGKRSLYDSLERRYNPIIRAITGMPKPIIAGINGVAAGAGLSLALAADIRIMNSAARMVEAFIGIALIPDSGATFFYPRMMGYAKAFEFATLNKPISAPDAERLGLVNSVVHPKAFHAALGAVAKKYASGPTQTYGFVKQLLQQGATRPLAEMLEMEKEYQQRAGDSSDYSEGVAAFIEKRPPAFTGS